LQLRAFALTSLAFAGSLASPAFAAPEPSAKLVRCGADSCLRVAGHRESPEAIVRINGRVVAAQGDSSWEVQLPIETVRAWSPPHARTIQVSQQDPQSNQEASSAVTLPIGLLGGVTELASLLINGR
jgi:hypothetical protein